MPINFGTQLFTSVNSLEPGQLIEFGYNGTTRWGVVVTPDWKDNCDCYVFDSKEDVPEVLLEWADQEPAVGVAYDTFGNQYTFKSFKTGNMSDIQNIEFDTYKEGEEVEGEEVEGQEVSDVEVDGLKEWWDALLRQLGLLETED